MSRTRMTNAKDDDDDNDDTLGAHDDDLDE